MADSDKDILITPNTGAAPDPSIVFSSGATGGDDISLFVTDDGTISTLSFEGSAGQLFSVSNDLTGIIFSVNDISGIPSIEVNADGTVSLAEFDGNVGIGTSSPTNKLDIVGPATANTDTGILVDSTGNAFLDLRADRSSGAETNNPYVRFRQDADAIETVIGHNDNANDSLGNAVTGAAANAFVIHNTVASSTISLGVNSSTGLTIDDNDRVYVGQDRIGYQSIVTGGFGSIQVDGAEGSGGTWTGYSIGGRTVFMDNADTATANRSGIYDDTNNEWLIQFNRGALGNNEADLYYSNAIKLTTTNTGIDVTGDVNTDTLNGLGFHASNGDAAPGADVFIRSNTSGYTYFSWINTVSGATTNVPDRIYTNQGGGDQFIRYQTVANFNSNVTSSATVGGDVTGTVGSISVTNDSHTHAFNNLTSKESGTGIYRTSANFQAVGGLIGTYDDAASGSWGGPIWGMDDGFTGPAGGVNALATSCYGLRWNRASASIANANIGEGLYVYQNGVLEGGIGTGGIYSLGNIRTDGSLIVEGTVGDTFSIRHDGTDAFIENLGTRYIDIELTSIVEARVQDSDTAGVTSGMQIKGHDQVLSDAGFNTLEVFNEDVSDTLEASHCGRVYFKDGTATITLTLDTGTDFPEGGVCTIINGNSTGNIVVARSTATLYYLDGASRSAGTANITVGPGGVATLWREDLASDIYYIWGSGLS